MPLATTPLTLPTYADVEAASHRLAGHAHRTPVMTSRTMNAELGAEVEEARIGAIGGGDGHEAADARSPPVSQPQHQRRRRG